MSDRPADEPASANGPGPAPEPAREEREGLKGREGRDGSDRAMAADGPGGQIPAAVPDDVWDKFLQDNEREIRTTAPKEPSARARRVTARLREQEARNQLPPAWRTGPAWQEMNGGARRRRRRRAVFGVILATAVVVVALKPSLLPGDPFGTSGSGSGTGTAASALPPETAAPTAAPGEVAPGTPTLDRPFAGSPAEQWADGEAGIVLPRATAVASFSKAQVKKALEQTKTLLVAGSLDPNTLEGSRPKAVFDVIDPRQKDVLTLLDEALLKPDKDHDPVTMFSRFDPGAIRLAGSVVKTRGRMTFKAGANGSLTVHTDYTFVYPVVRPDDSAGEVTRTVVRRVLDTNLQDPARYLVTPGKIDITNYRYDASNSTCGVFDGYLHPAFTTAAPGATGTQPAGPTSDPYDRSQELAAGSDAPCGTASRV